MCEYSDRKEQAFGSGVAAHLGTPRLPRGDGAQASLRGAMRVLVVEDDDLVRTVAVDALEDAGFEVIEAATAEEAIDRCEQRRADVLLTEIMLSGTFDGWDLAEQCRSADPDLGHLH